MRAVRRSAWHWGKVLGEILLLGTAGSLVLNVCTLLGRSSLDPGIIAETTAFTWIVITVMIFVVYTIGWFENYLPVMLAFGATRKEAVWGLEVSKLVISLVLGLIGGMLLNLTAEGKSAGEAAATVLMIFILVSIAADVGELYGNFYYKFGKIAIVCIGIFFGVLGGILGLTVSIGVKGKTERLFDAIENLENYLWLVGIAGLVLFAASALCTGLIMRKAQVRM